MPAGRNESDVISTKDSDASAVDAIEPAFKMLR